jgi:hypothetical protein
MHSVSRGLVGLSMIALLACALVMGCGGGDKGGGPMVKNDTDNRSPTSTGSGPATQGSGGTTGGGGSLQPIDNSKVGTLKGSIIVENDAAAIVAALNKKQEEDMKGKESGFCLEGSPAEVANRMYRVGANKQLGNVFVYLAPPPGHYFKIDKKEVDAAKGSPVEIDQPHCAFVPHAVVAFPVYRTEASPGKPTKTGQKMGYMNSSPKVTHNTHFENTNDTIPANTTNPRDFTGINYNRYVNKEPMEIKCDIHGWMRAYVLMLDSPYGAVSLSDSSPKPVKLDDKNFGTYEIKNVPAGTKLLLRVWHEELGYLNANGAAGEEIQLEPGKETVKDFKVTVKPPAGS